MERTAKMYNLEPILKMQKGWDVKAHPFCFLTLLPDPLVHIMAVFQRRPLFFRGYHLHRAGKSSDCR